MRFAEISNGTITNVVECDEEFATANGLTSIDGLDPTPGIGWTLAAGDWSPPAAPTQTAAQAAQDSLQAMFAQAPAMAQQIAADAQLFASTPVGSTLTADHLAALQRVVNGFSTVLDAIQAHATYTGAIQ